MLDLFVTMACVAVIEPDHASYLLSLWQEWQDAGLWVTKLEDAWHLAVCKAAQQYGLPLSESMQDTLRWNEIEKAEKAKAAARKAKAAAKKAARAQ